MQALHGCGLGCCCHITALAWLAVTHGMTATITLLELAAVEVRCNCINLTGLEVFDCFFLVMLAVVL
jgi:hypothetical protein